MRTSTNINRVHCVPLFCCVYMYFRYLILLLILWRTTCNKGINNRHIQMNDDKWLLQRIEHSHNTYTLPPWRILIGYIVFRSFAVQVAFVLAFQLAEHYMQQQSDENSYLDTWILDTWLQKFRQKTIQIVWKRYTVEIRWFIRYLKTVSWFITSYFYRLIQLYMTHISKLETLVDFLLWA